MIIIKLFNSLAELPNLCIIYIPKVIHMGVSFFARSVTVLHKVISLVYFSSRHTHSLPTFSTFSSLVSKEGPRGERTMDCPCFGVSFILASVIGQRMEAAWLWYNRVSKSFTFLEGHCLPVRVRVLIQMESMTFSTVTIPTGSQMQYA